MPDPLAGSTRWTSINASVLQDTASIDGARPAPPVPDAGWRIFLQSMGISAAILSFVANASADKRATGGRHAYLIGLEEARADPQLRDGLLLFAEQQWQDAAGESFRDFRIKDAVSDPCRVSPFSSPPSRVSQILSCFDHAAAMRATGPGGTIYAVLLRAVGAGGFEQCRPLLQALAPNLVGAAATFAEAMRQQQKSRLLEAMLDRVSLAIMLVDAAGRPLFCNEAANTVLENRDPLLRASDGGLASPNCAETRRLREAIQMVATAEFDSDIETALRVPTGDGNWRIIFIVPARAPAASGGARCAMIVVGQGRTCEAPEKFLSALGLLPSEQRFLKAFLRSSSIAEAAGQSGLSEETARTYLKRVRGKLGVHRQMELAQLIYGMVPPLRQSAANCGASEL